MTTANRRTTYIIKIAMVAIFAAMSFVCTAFLPIPIAGGQGYLNFSDTFIYILASFISPLVGGLVGALSGSLSDILCWIWLFCYKDSRNKIYRRNCSWIFIYIVKKNFIK